MDVTSPFYSQIELLSSPLECAEIIFLEELSLLLEDESPIEKEKVQILKKDIENNKFSSVIQMLKADKITLERLEDNLSLDRHWRLFLCVVQKRERLLVKRMLQNKNILQYLKGLSVSTPEGAQRLRIPELLPVLRMAFSGYFSDIVKIIWDNPELVSYCQGVPVPIDEVFQVIKFDELIDLFKAALSARSSYVIKKLWLNEKLSAYLTGEKVFIEENFRQLTLDELVAFFRTVLCSSCSEVIKAIWRNKTLANYIKGFPVRSQSEIKVLKPQKIIEIFGNALPSHCTEVIQDIWCDPTSPIQRALPFLEREVFLELADRIFNSRCQKQFLREFVNNITSVDLLTCCIAKQQALERVSNNRYNLLVLHERLAVMKSTTTIVTMDDRMSQSCSQNDIQPVLLSGNSTNSHRTINEVQMSSEIIKSMSFRHQPALRGRKRWRVDC